MRRISTKRATLRLPARGETAIAPIPRMFFSTTMKMRKIHWPIVFQRQFQTLTNSKRRAGNLSCKVVRLLPVEDGECQYRIKCTYDNVRADRQGKPTSFVSHKILRVAEPGETMGHVKTKARTEFALFDVSYEDGLFDIETARWHCIR